ncbi:MAG: MOSC domain-containing protein [Alphaproteobacteria bacterium]
MMDEITLDRIMRYPVKGLSGQEVELTELITDRPLSHDRAFAIATSASQFDPAEPGWVSKQGLAQLAKHERLAQLATEYDPSTTELTINRNGRKVTSGKLNDQTGKLVVENFLDAFLGDDVPGHPRIITAPDTAFTDVKRPYLSILNLATVAEISRMAEIDLDPIRFRANLYITGAPAWAERNWIGSRMTVGPAVLEIEQPIDRCAATSVNPETATRDINLPQFLRRRFVHIECGVYARVTHSGTISPGDPITVSDMELDRS